MHNELLIFEFGVALLLAGAAYKIVARIKKRKNKGSSQEDETHWI